MTKILKGKFIKNFHIKNLNVYLISTLFFKNPNFGTFLHIEIINKMTKILKGKFIRNFNIKNLNVYLISTPFFQKSNFRHFLNFKLFNQIEYFSNKKLTDSCKMVGSHKPVGLSWGSCNVRLYGTLDPQVLRTFVQPSSWAPQGFCYMEWTYIW